MTAARKTEVAAQTLGLLDHEPERETFMHAVLAGLSNSPKTLPSAYFYDKRGSELFDRICDLPEYYPTRTEMGILDGHLGEMAEALGPDVMLIEYGSGAGIKTRRLLRALQTPVAYVPVEISREHLLQSAMALDAEFPSLEVIPVCADFTEPFEVPRPARAARRRALYFPGSTIGNFMRPAATRLLEQMGDEVGQDGAILIGVDLRKNVATLELAYNDAEGVTADFNLNILRRMNSELAANFDEQAFEHKAVWVEERGAIEMRLYSRRAQTVSLGDREIEFTAGEWIHTEDSHKYSVEEFEQLAGDAGLRVERVWTDPLGLFSVQYVTAPG
jgi:dimethylhistidine N-methyltransferase